MNSITTLFKKKLRRWQGLALLWFERRKENADLAIFAYEGLFQALMLNLATVFTNMYATRLGATATEIGLISSGPQFFAMLLLIPACLALGKLATPCRNFGSADWRVLRPGSQCSFYGSSSHSCFDSFYFSGQCSAKRL